MNETDFSLDLTYQEACAIQGFAGQQLWRKNAWTDIYHKINDLFAARRPTERDTNMSETKIPDGWEQFDPEPGDRVWWAFGGYVGGSSAEHYYVGPSRFDEWGMVVEVGPDMTDRIDAAWVAVRPVETVTVTLRRDDAHVANEQLAIRQREVPDHKTNDAIVRVRRAILDQMS